MDKYIPGIGVTAGSFMLKWELMDKYIKSHSLKIQPGDNVNIFINFESILNNLYNYKNINSLLIYHKQNFVIELESAILNLLANYKAYFTKEKCNAKVYLYYTDLNSENQSMMIYNKYYRTYYQNKYKQNPKFRNVGNVLLDTIIPEIDLITSYIPNVYFIKSKSFDGSLIPEIISQFDINSKNVIISSDLFDTLYMFNPNFITLYIRRRYGKLILGTDVDIVIQDIINTESPFNLNIFKSEMYYKLLLSIHGNVIRNIKTIRGLDYNLIIKLLNDGITNGMVLNNFESLSSIIEIFPDRYRDDIKSSFKCMDLNTQYDLLSQIDKDYIKSQIIDKIDISSVEALNNQRFLLFPINLQSLLI